MPSLTGEAIQYYSCFISYASQDDAFVERLYADLQNSGVRCWYAPEDLEPGQVILDAVDRAIKVHDKLVLILSDAAVNSNWVKHEVETALRNEVQVGRDILFPIRLDDAVMETNVSWADRIRQTRHIGEFTAWKDHDSYQLNFKRLLQDLKGEAAST